MQMPARKSPGHDLPFTDAAPLTVLMVDDDPTLLELMSGVLVSLGYRTAIASNGGEAVAILKDSSFDIVITDLVMPHMDGIELLAHIQESYPETYVIVATGFSGEYSYADIIRAGAADYIAKPITRAELRAKLDRICRERGLILAYRQEITERKQAEMTLQKIVQSLDKRVKELNCLYGISSLREKRFLSLEKVFQLTLELIPPAWQFPDITCAMIDYYGRQFSTENFRETPWMQKKDIFIRERLMGSVMVCYLEEKPALDEGPFLKEERNLLNAIAERLGNAAEHFQAEEALQKLHEECQLREAEHAREIAGNDHEMPDAPSGRRKLLVVDDDEGIRKALRKLLTAEGYEVMVASDGIVAFEQMRMNPADLIITDIFMPEQDGILTIREVAKYFPATKIIAVSGDSHLCDGTVDFLDVAKRVGAQRTFSKPLDTDLFLGAIKELLDKP